MRITGWSIDGFGQFHKAEVTDLPPGLIVVHGPNESGKTTSPVATPAVARAEPESSAPRRASSLPSVLDPPEDDPAGS